MAECFQSFASERAAEPCQNAESEKPGAPHTGNAAHAATNSNQQTTSNQQQALGWLGAAWKQPIGSSHQALKGTWCSGITSASHAEGPGFKSQCVHASEASSSETQVHPQPLLSAWACLLKPFWAFRLRCSSYSHGSPAKHIRGSIVVSISACHAEDPGSIPGRGVSLPGNE